MNIFGRWPMVLMTILCFLRGYLTPDFSHAAVAEAPHSEHAQQPLLQKSLQQPTSKQTYPSPGEAANSALELIKAPSFFRDEMGGIERAKKLGFESLAEVATATLGKALPVINVNLEKLRDFKAEDDPKTLVVDPHTVIFPVYIKAEVRSSLTVSDPSRTNSWVQMERGSPILIRKIEKVRKQQELPDDAFFLVQNRGIGLRFLARKSGHALTLTSLDSFAFGRFVLIAGEERPAQEIILGLRPVAKKLFDIYEHRKDVSKPRTRSSVSH